MNKDKFYRDWEENSMTAACNAISVMMKSPTKPLTPH